VVVEAHAFVLDRGKQEVTCRLCNSVLVVHVTDRRELLLAESTVDYVLVILIASSEEHEDWALIGDGLPDALELGGSSHLFTSRMNARPFAVESLLKKTF
jgi:hypothetical protein